MDARGLGNPILFPESLQSVGGDLVERLLWIWREVRAPLIAPLMRVIVFVCLLTNVLLFLERVYMGIVVTFVKIFRRTPERKYKWKPLVTDDIELGNSAYPKVLVQIPMFNEREVYKISIGACCGLSWPTDNLIIQVLDDSTDPSVKELVSAECQRWASKGINIKYEIREKRTGYKAGALKEGMKRSYVRDCDYVVIFDADFRPEPDFLHRTIPFLIHNPELALVQTRWKFVNADECLLTRIQEMSLDYHFTVEQEVGSSTHAFFGFNGTAGVWRISAINEAGGWKERTTVEDMDLAVRASLKGWKFVYIGAVSVRNELPSTFKAFRFQQHRWSCGPANLFRKMFMEIIRCKKVTAKKKFYVIYNFFIIRKIIAHVVTFIFYCIVIPASVMVPEVEIPNWGAVYIPVIVTLLNSVGTPRSFHLVFFWILFENVMSMHRTKATVIGLLEAGRVNEWVVTEKLGDTLKAKATPNTNSNSNSKHLNASSKQTVVVKKPRSKFLERLNFLELMVAIYIFFCATYDFAFGKNNFFIYLYVQSTAFLVVGLGYVGTFVPS